MNLEEIQKRKDTLEEEMETLLNEFITETNVKIDEVYVRMAETGKLEVALALIRDDI